jgi:hypothetical protein
VKQSTVNFLYIYEKAPRTEGKAICVGARKIRIVQIRRIPCTALKEEYFVSALTEEEKSRYLLRCTVSTQKLTNIFYQKEDELYYYRL